MGRRLEKDEVRLLVVGSQQESVILEYQCYIGGEGIINSLINTRQQNYISRTEIRKYFY